MLFLVAYSVTGGQNELFAWTFSSTEKKSVLSF